MNKPGITSSASTRWCEVSCRGRMAGLVLVLLARIWERLGVAAESIVPSPIQYRFMLLASSHPHDDFSIKVLGAQIVLWPMDLPCHRCVLTEAVVDGHIAVRLGPVLWVVADAGRRLALVGHSKCLEDGARLATM